jgi:hypothetical protein
MALTAEEAISGNGVPVMTEPAVPAAMIATCATEIQNALCFRNPITATLRYWRRHHMGYHGI